MTKTFQIENDIRWAMMVKKKIMLIDVDGRKTKKLTCMEVVLVFCWFRTKQNDMKYVVICKRYDMSR